jgi:hypothetical protein
MGETMTSGGESPPVQTQTARILDKFGGDAPNKVVRMAELTGHPEHRIYNWLRAGFIPEKYRQDLLDTAYRLGVDHTPFDYIAYMVVPRGALAAAA